MNAAALRRDAFEIRNATANRNNLAAPKQPQLSARRIVQMGFT
jgi:hypothetical protein